MRSRFKIVRYTALFCLLIPLLVQAQTGGISMRIVDTDITQFPVVWLKVEIRRNGNLISSVNKSNFRIIENGVAQQAESVVCPDDTALRLSIGILLDRSGSMRMQMPDSTKIKAAKKAISVFLGFLESRDEAALFSFSSNHTEKGDTSVFFTVNHPFTHDTAAIRRALVPIVGLGGTWIWTAMLRTLDSLALRAGRKVLITLTDGRSDGDTGVTDKNVVDKAIKEKIPLYMIGLGSDVYGADLTSMANSTGGKYYFSPTTERLEEIFRLLAGEIITDACLIKYTSTNSCFDGSKRDVEVTLTVPGFITEDSTSYVVAKNLNPVTLVVGSDFSVDSKSSFNVPIFIKEFLSKLEPLTYKFTVTYDPALLAFNGVKTDGTISQGGNVLVTETSPGMIEISLSGHIPASETGVLIELEFSSSGQSVDKTSLISITDASLNQFCPTDVQTVSNSVTLLACRENFVVGASESYVAEQGNILRLPVQIFTDARPGTFVSVTFKVKYDMNVFRYIGFDRSKSFPDMTGVLVTLQGDQINVNINGTTSDTTGILLYLKFSAIETLESISTAIEIRDADVKTACRSVSKTEDPVVLINGVCEPIVSRKATHQYLKNHPNPFNPVTGLTFSVLSDNTVNLTVCDWTGREVAALLRNAHLFAGEYRIEFNGTALPTGTYYAVLIVGERRTVRPMLLLK